MHRDLIPLSTERATTNFVARHVLFGPENAILEDIFGRYEAAIVSPLGDGAEMFLLNELFWEDCACRSGTTGCFQVRRPSITHLEPPTLPGNTYCSHDEPRSTFYLSGRSLSRPS